MILGIDPGKDKCGIALIGLDRKVYLRSVVASGDLLRQMARLVEEFQVATVVIGNQTTSRYWQQQILTHFPSLRLVSIPEENSSQQARIRYWQFNPPRGIHRLIPVGMRVPPAAYDDVVAVILVERYFEMLADVNQR